MNICVDEQMVRCYVRWAYMVTMKGKPGDGD